MSSATRTGATRRRLDAGRWHFQHGPIDCIVGAEGEASAVAECTERAWLRFATVLDELVGELPLLRADLSRPDSATLAPCGAVAQRMFAACRPHAAAGRFITAMAAVAGSVAEELIGCFAAPGIARASVNNGGDIALHLGTGASFDIGLVADPTLGLAGAAPDGRFRVDARSGVRGVATSGWRGRSLSLGIADAATVLAPTASAADAAATIVANAVDVEFPGIVRRPACSVRDDSDLGDRLVTCAVPRLSDRAVEDALAAGVEIAQGEIAAGRIVAAVLWLQGRFVVVEGGAAPQRVASRSASPAARPTALALRQPFVQRGGAPYSASAT